MAGFASAVLLMAIAGLMVFGSVERFFFPEPIHYQEAILVAATGLIVNVVCAQILGGAHHHGHGHHNHAHDKHDHGHAHHHDLNLQSAYVHVIADAATSVLAIIALIGGWLYGWSWLDLAMGIVGAILVGAWAKNLLRGTGKILLDREMDHPVVEEIRDAIESNAEDGCVRITDLHVWRIGKQHDSCIPARSVSSPRPRL